MKNMNRKEKFQILFLIYIILAFVLFTICLRNILIIKNIDKIDVYSNCYGIMMSFVILIFGYTHYKNKNMKGSNYLFPILFSKYLFEAFLKQNFDAVAGISGFIFILVVLIIIVEKKEEFFVN